MSDAEKLELISQCAESFIFLDRAYNIPKTEGPSVKAILKERRPKKYRIPEIEKTLTKKRTKRETRSLLKAEKLGVRVPEVYFSDEKGGRIYMEYMEGYETLKKAMVGLRGKMEVGGVERTRRDKKKREEGQEFGIERVFYEVGRRVGLMHEGGLIHGDLTSSNIMVKDGDVVPVFIDFGLSYIR